MIPTQTQGPDSTRPARIRIGFWRAILWWAVVGASLALLYAILFMTPAILQRMPLAVEGPLRVSMLFLFPAWVVWVGTIGETRMSALPVYGALGIAANAVLWGLAGLVWRIAGSRTWSKWVVRFGLMVFVCSLVWSVLRASMD